MPQLTIIGLMCFYCLIQDFEETQHKGYAKLTCKISHNFNTLNYGKIFLVDVKRIIRASISLGLLPKVVNPLLL